MRRLIEGLRRCAWLVYRLLPKARWAVIWGWPDYEDSVLALEQELQATPARRVVLLLTDRRAEPPEPLGPKTWRVTKDSPLGWLTFLVARYVFFTHRCFMRRFPPNVVSVNVWHGMPIKRIGWLCEGDEGIESRFVLATSPFWAEIMERSMEPSGGALATGLPRNDRLFLARDRAWDALGLTERDDVEQLAVWLPTYRRSVRGHLTVDGRPTDTPFELDIDPAALNRFLAERRTLALVKPHPMAAFQGEQEWSHLRIVDDAWLRARRLSLYRVVGAADLLISDVSSVTIDYLVLDRPIVHALADLEEYQQSRGFSVDRIDDLLMGPVATSFDELAAVLDQVLAGKDPDADRRQRVRELSHTDPGPGATTRLLRELQLLGGRPEGDPAP